MSKRFKTIFFITILFYTIVPNYNNTFANAIEDLKMDQSKPELLTDTINENLLSDEKTDSNPSSSDIIDSEIKNSLNITDSNNSELDNKSTAKDSVDSINSSLENIVPNINDSNNNSSEPKEAEVISNTTEGSDVLESTKDNTEIDGYIPLENEAPNEVCIFKDVCSTHWAYNAISWMVEKNYIKGYPNFTFKPNNTVTKEEFATILVNVFNLEESSEPQISSFEDISEDRWSFKFIELGKPYLTNFKNEKNTFFSPKENYLREDVTVAIIKAMNLDTSNFDLNTLENFLDTEDIPSEFLKYISIAVEKNIVKGYPVENSNAKYFRPKKTISRAEVAALLYSVFKNKNLILEETKDSVVSSIETTPVPDLDLKNTPTLAPTPEVTPALLPTTTPTALPSPTSTPVPVSTVYTYKLNGEATWHNTDYFKIAIPNSWEETTPNDSEDVIITKSFTSNKDFFFTMNVRGLDELNISITDYLNMFKQSSSLVNLLSAKEMQFKDLDAAEIHVKLLLAKQKLLVVIDSKNIYEFFYVCDANNFDSNLASINEVIESIEFIDNNTPRYKLAIISPNE